MRRAGTGSIDPVTRADGTVAYYPRLPTRQRLDPWPTREEAELALDEALHQIAEGKLVHPSGISVAIWGRKCIAKRREDALALGLGRRNADIEMDRWAGHVEEQPLGKMGLSEATTADVLEWLGGRLRAKARPGHGHKTEPRRRLGRSTIADALRLVRMAFGAAMQTTPPLRTDNPAAVVKMPAERRTHDPWTWLRPEEVAALFATGPEPRAPHQRAAATLEAWEEDRDAALYALYTGVRQGEQWTQHLRDVRLEAGRIVVRYGGREGELLLPTKSGRPRELQLLAPALAVVKRQIARLEKRSNPRGLLWPTTARTHPGAFRGACQAPRSFAPWVARAGLTPDRRGELVAVTWHSLRHTFATLVLAGLLPGAGPAWRLEKVSAYLGHTDIDVTQRYADTAALLLPDPNDVPTAVVDLPETAAIPGRVELPTNGLGNRSDSKASAGMASNLGGSRAVASPLGQMSREQLEELVLALSDRLPGLSLDRTGLSLDRTDLSKPVRRAK